MAHIARKEFGWGPIKGILQKQHRNPLTKRNARQWACAVQVKLALKSPKASAVIPWVSGTYCTPDHKVKVAFWWIIRLMINGSRWLRVNSLMMEHGTKAIYPSLSSQHQCEYSRMGWEVAPPSKSLCVRCCISHKRTGPGSLGANES